MAGPLFEFREIKKYQKIMVFGLGLKVLSLD
jgi:hypothetical protein